ncbi:hypothetical protein KSP39_PZI000326 [Platanthera zijinensis]|uniref:Uncharacterized protein n=1 Tax=Platanthera zijinensis TaxID=2320716 RepID=A0AAP0C058_9ASPA
MKLWVEDEDERKAEKACRMQLTVLNDALHEFLDKHYQLIPPPNKVMGLELNVENIEEISLVAMSYSHRMMCLIF